MRVTSDEKCGAGFTFWVEFDTPEDAQWFEEHFNAVSERWPYATVSEDGNIVAWNVESTVSHKRPPQK